MKRLMSLFIIFVLVCSFVGCGGQIEGITDFSRFKGMTKSADKIEISLDNNDGSSFDFTVTDSVDISEIMEILFSSRFKRNGKTPAPGDNTAITVVQGAQRYTLNISFIKEGGYCYYFKDNRLQAKVSALAQAAKA